MAAADPHIPAGAAGDDLALHVGAGRAGLSFTGWVRPRREPLVGVEDRESAHFRQAEPLRSRLMPTSELARKTDNLDPGPASYVSRLMLYHEVCPSGLGILTSASLRTRALVPDAHRDLAEEVVDLGLRRPD